MKKKFFCVLLCAFMLFALSACQLESQYISEDVPLPRRYGNGISTSAEPTIAIWDYSGVPMQLSEEYIKENFEPSSGDSLLWLHKEYNTDFCIDYHSYNSDGSLILYDSITDPEADLAMHSYDANGNLVMSSVSYTTDAHKLTKALTFKDGALVSYELQKDARTPDENGGYVGSTAFYDANGVLTGSEYLYAIPEKGMCRSVSFDADGKMTGAYYRAKKGSTYYFAYYNKNGGLNFYEVQTPNSTKYYNAYGKQVSPDDVSSFSFGGK